MVTAGLFVLGLAVLLAGGELLVRGASGLALRVGLTPLVVGLTVVSLGTSSPELAVSTAAALRGQADIALGNVVGSNIANVLLVLGLAALVRPVAVPRQLLRLDGPVMLVASAAVLALALDGRIGRWEGLGLVTCVVLYTGLLVRTGRRAAADRGEGASGGGSLPLRVCQIVAGLAALVMGARWIVQGAVTLARFLGISELVIGLTVVAVGTSLPEVVSSAVASRRGEGDIACGNVIGSNTFNLLLVLGAAAALSPRGIAVAPGVLRLDLPVMVATALAAFAVMSTRRRVGRWEGVLFLGLYAAYLTRLVLGVA